MLSDEKPIISFEQIIDLSTYQSYKDEYLCELCQHILLNPVSCSSCGKTYCRDCILPYIMEKLRCPNNCSTFEIVKPSQDKMKKFTSFEILCKNCESSFPLVSFYTHYKQCVNGNDKVMCWNCGREKMNKEIKYKTYDDYSFANEYKAKMSFEGDNPFMIAITTKDFSGYVGYKDDYLIVEKEKYKGAIFSELTVDGKNYIKILMNEKWKFLGPHYDRGVIIYRWKFSGPIIIDKANQCMISDDGRTKGSLLTMRITDKRLYFYKETNKYQLCQVSLKYL